MEIVENGLVGDFPRQAHVARRHRVRGRAHEHAAPMRRRARHVRRPMRAESRQVLGDRLLRIGENQRAAVEHRAQQDLQPAVAPDVVERRPHDAAVAPRARFDRGGEAGERVHDHLGDAGRARGEENPLRSPGAGPRRRVERDRRGTDDGERHAERAQVARVLVGNDRVDAGFGDHGREMLARKIRRAENHPARDAVELDQRQCGGELVAGEDEHARAVERGEVATEARAVHEIRERNAGAARVEKALAAVRRLVQERAQRPCVTRRHLGRHPRRPARDRRR